MHGRGKAALCAAATLAVGTIIATAPLGAGAQGFGVTGPCKVAKSVELINDDSSSMLETDPGKNRVEAANLLLNKAANRGGSSFGAVEFAEEASPLFAVTKVSSSTLAALTGSIASRTNGDGSGAPLAEDPSTNDQGFGTDYNAAFAAANQQNGGADARVFLTDGGHSQGVYNNGHLSPKIPTHVVGFGGVSGTDNDRLAGIAKDTGGIYVPVTDSASLTDAVNKIDDRLGCSTRTKQFIDQFNTVGQVKTHKLNVVKKTQSLTFTLLWNGAQNKFDLRRVQILRKGKIVAQGSKRSKLKVSRRTGATFVTIRVRGRSLRKGGRLRFKVKPKLLAAPAFLRTTVAQNKRK
jgi:hypothetical protein